eukprot:COSAG01_NODE_155_length_23814_cov_12.061343_9_plen_119_part_00
MKYQVVGMLVNPTTDGQLQPKPSAAHLAQSCCASNSSMCSNAAKTHRYSIMRNSSSTRPSRARLIPSTNSIKHSAMPPTFNTLWRVQRHASLNNHARTLGRSDGVVLHGTVLLLLQRT